MARSHLGQREMTMTLESTSNIKVPMGGIGYGKSPDVLETLLGSCVGVVIWCF